MICFIEATLGFEAEAIRKAVEALAEAEQSSTKYRAKAQRSGIKTSSKYPLGTEYALTLAEAHLMTAVSLFLSESVLDTAKALFRLRKAYQVLDEISKVTYGQSAAQNLRSSQSMSSFSGISKMETSSVSSFSSDTTKNADILEAAKKVRLARLQRNERASNLSSETLASSVSEESGEVDAEAGYESMDEFIKTGVDAMFGLLQLIISIIPSGVGKFLSVVGFKGSREDGLRMLWRASKVKNIHGSLALLALLQYYGGQNSEIEDGLAKDDEQPSEKSEEGSRSSSESSLSTVRTNDLVDGKDEVLELIRNKLKTRLDSIAAFYPHGILWAHQRARMISAKGDLEKAVDVMSDESMGPIQMKQAEGLMLFDKTIMQVILHRYEEAAENFIKLTTINTWSLPLYMYFSTACYVEIYREFKHSDPEKASKAKEIALERVKEIQPLFGKKGFMAKTMPFDVFVQRKLNQLTATSEAENVDMVDAFGTSPANECIYFWNGIRQMPEQYLKKSLEILGYSGAKDTPFSAKEEPPLIEVEDERMTRYMLQSSVLKSLGRLEEGIDLLDNHVLPLIWSPVKGKIMKSGLPRVQYHKHHRDPWVGPTIIYERAILEWKLNGLEAKDRVLDYLELASQWSDDYELSTRINMRIRGATEKLMSL